MKKTFESYNDEFTSICDNLGIKNSIYNNISDIPEDDYNLS